VRRSVGEKSSGVKRRGSCVASVPSAGRVRNPRGLRAEPELGRWSVGRGEVRLLAWYCGCRNRSPPERTRFPRSGLGVRAGTRGAAVRTCREWAARVCRQTGAALHSFGKNRVRVAVRTVSAMRVRFALVIGLEGARRVRCQLGEKRSCAAGCVRWSGRRESRFRRGCRWRRRVRSRWATNSAATRRFAHTAARTARPAASPRKVSGRPDGLHQPLASAATSTGASRDP
jgi:hypothetical protein